MSDDALESFVSKGVGVDTMAVRSATGLLTFLTPLLSESVLLVLLEEPLVASLCVVFALFVFFFFFL